MSQAHRLWAIRAATGDQDQVKTKVKRQKTKLKGLFYIRKSETAGQDREKGDVLDGCAAHTKIYQKPGSRKQKLKTV